MGGTDSRFPTALQTHNCVREHEEAVKTIFGWGKGRRRRTTGRERETEEERRLRSLSHMMSANILEFLKQPPLHYHTHATCRFDLPLCTCPPSHAASLPFRLQALFAAHLSTFTAATAACWSVGAGSVLISQGIYTYAQLPVLPQLTVKIFLTH